MYKREKIKGVHIYWNGTNIFPLYKKCSGPIVSQRRINRLKYLVKMALEEEKGRIQQAFELFARRRYPGKRVTMNLPLAIERINNTHVCRGESMYGESDETGIWIAKSKLSDAYLFGTMLHEAMHFLCTWSNNKYMSESDEHMVMRSLGEDCL
tara:strand:+ start:1006 stop:1464 length:459 start_codon:yes stop_codon:yes gene_type:complete